MNDRRLLTGFSPRASGLAVAAAALWALTAACAGALAATLAAPPSAAPPAESAHPLPNIAPQYAELARRLEKQFPEYSVDGIQPSGVEGIVEVLLGQNRIVYSDLAGKHIFSGHLFELDTHVDLTERRLTEITRIDPKQLPLADAFDVVHGAGKRQIYLFEDPDCPFCKKFEEELPKVKDVTFHIFLYPLTSIHPHAYDHALAVWCSKDRQKAWSDKMLKGIDPAAAKCDNPINRNLTLGDKLHIDGTPTMIFADGRVHAGTVSADELEQLLAGPN
jgi:thiol:disulfide interchange protein DsbC